MAKKIDPKYTIVQHSGYGYGGKEEWAGGVEVRTVSAVTDLRKVEKVGGLLFDTRQEADDFEDKLNLDGPGMYPQVKGTFSNQQVDSLAIYIPVRQVVG